VKIISSMLRMTPLVMWTFASHSLLAQSMPQSSKASQTTRSIFLNGVDISNARQQELRSVHVQIDSDGNVFIKAPHYQVTEEETFIPLSSTKSPPNSPHHTALMDKSATASASIPATNPGVDSTASNTNNPPLTASGSALQPPSRDSSKEVINKPVPSGKAQPSQPATPQSPRL
jgi:hypothetical protein